MSGEDLVVTAAIYALRPFSTSDGRGRTYTDTTNRRSSLVSHPQMQKVH